MNLLMNFKKGALIGASMLIFLLCVSGCSYISSEAGGYSDPNTKLLIPDAAGRLEAAGNDLRVYEFTPQTAQNKQCIFVAAGRKAGLVCFDK